MIVQEIVDRLKKSGAGATLHTGKSEAEVAGIAVTYTPSLDVLRKAVATGKNLIVSREGPFWAQKPETLSANPTYISKREFIDTNRLAILQLREPPAGQGMDLHQQALADALGWGGPQTAGTYFQVPETTLDALARSVEQRLKIHAARVLGGPATKVRKVALTHGRMMVPALRKVMQEPDVDAVIVGEPIEWEAGPYFQDLIAMGQKKGLIAIGLEASEEPGSKLTATWLKSLVPGLPIEWIPSGEPFNPLLKEAK